MLKPRYIPTNSSTDQASHQLRLWLRAKTYGFVAVCPWYMGRERFGANASSYKSSFPTTYKVYDTCIDVNIFGKIDI